MTLVETVKGSPLSGGDSGGLSVLGGNAGADSNPVVEVPATTTQYRGLDRHADRDVRADGHRAGDIRAERDVAGAVLESGLANHRILRRGVELGVDQRDRDSEPGSVVAGGRRGEPFERRGDRDRVGGRHGSLGR